MVTTKKKLLIAGASGLVGGAALARFGQRDDWEVLGISRRKPWIPAGHATHLSVDLADREACARIFSAQPDVTHVIFAAVNERDDDIQAGWHDTQQIAKNAAMLTNMFDPLLPVATGLRHVSIMHGAKAYGLHLPGYNAPVPVYEDMPRHPGDNFYHRQQDYITARQQGTPWSWTIFRPGPIYGIAIGPNMSTLLVLAVYASLCREAGRKLSMPVGQSGIVEPVDADLLAEAFEWAMDAPTARNEIFNINNGDLFSCYDAFPLFARCLNIPLGQPRGFDIVAEIAELAGLWPEIVRKHRLNVPQNLDELFGNSLQVGAAWSADIDRAHLFLAGILSTTKLRQAGFQTCMDSRGMFEKYIRRMQELRMIPAT